MLLLAAVVVLAAIGGSSAVFLSSDSEPAAGPSLAAPGTAAVVEPAGGDTDGVAVGEGDFSFAGVERASFPALEADGYRCLGRGPVPDDFKAFRQGSESYSQPGELERERLEGLSAEMYDCLKVCLPEDTSSWDGHAVTWAEPCVNHHLIELTRRYGSAQFFPVLAAVMRDHPELNDTCHEGGHAGGDLVITELGERYEDALGRIGRECLGGVQHGILDALGATSPSVDDVVSVAKVCEQVGPAGPECAHGIGHAAWDAFEDFDLAAGSACGAMNLELLEQCGHGIVMRYYERNGLPETLDDLDWLLDDLVELCATQWPDGNSPAGDPLKAGCWYGIGYAMWYPLFVTKYSAHEPADLRDAVAQISATCARLEPQGQARCDSESGRYLASISYWEKPVAEELCGYIAGDREQCRRDVGRHIDSTLGLI
jgi:hypothetical protein